MSVRPKSYLHLASGLKAPGSGDGAPRVVHEDRARLLAQIGVCPPVYEVGATSAVGQHPMAHRTPTPTPTEPTHRQAVPLAVWPVAQRSGQAQRAGRYLPESSTHPAKMLPELARRIVVEYSEAGQLVCDPMAGIGTTVLEAACLGRRAVGIELEARWADLARRNLDHALDATSRPLADIRQGDARRLPAVLGELAGNVDLVVTSPPYACDVGNLDKSHWQSGGDLCPSATRNYSTDRANLGHARDERYRFAMAEIYAACHAVLRPGGLLVAVTKNTRRSGRCLDLAALTVSLAERAGFSYLQHSVALLAKVNDGDLAARPSFFALTQLLKARARGEPCHLVCHEDVLAFVATSKETADAR